MIHGSKPGFTLIELLTSLGIIGALLAVGLPLLRQFGLRQQVGLAAQEVRNAVLQVQSYALSPRQEDGEVVEYQLLAQKDPTGNFFYETQFKKRNGSLTSIDKKWLSPKICIVTVTATPANSCSGRPLFNGSVVYPVNQDGRASSQIKMRFLSVIDANNLLSRVPKNLTVEQSGRVRID